MAGAGLAGNLPQSAFGASQEGRDATAKGRVLSPHIFFLLQICCPTGKSWDRWSKCVVPPHLDRCLQEWGAEGH